MNTHETAPATAGECVRCCQVGTHLDVCPNNPQVPLYWNQQSGEVACIDHIGFYATAAITGQPSARSWDTPLGTWNRVSAWDRRDWHEEFGRSIECETCKYRRPN